MNFSNKVLLFQSEVVLRELRLAAIEIATRYSMPPFLLVSIARAENAPLDPFLMGEAGELGLFQLTPIALEDVQNQTGQAFDPRDLRQAAEAAAIYWNMCNRYNIYYGIPVSQNNTLITWNRGIGNALDSYKDAIKYGLNPDDLSRHPTATQGLLGRFNSFLLEEEEAFNSGLYK